jgi:hypothetical protein
LHVFNREVFHSGRAGRYGDRLDDFGRVQALLDVDLSRRKAGICGRAAASSSPISMKVVSVAVVWPGTAATVSSREAWKVPEFAWHVDKNLGLRLMDDCDMLFEDWDSAILYGVWGSIDGVKKRDA